MQNNYLGCSGLINVIIEHVRAHGILWYVETAFIKNKFLSYCEFKLLRVKCALPQQNKCVNANIWCWGTLESTNCSREVHMPIR